MALVIKLVGFSPRQLKALRVEGFGGGGAHSVRELAKADPRAAVIRACRLVPGLNSAQLQELTGLPNKTLDDVCWGLYSNGEITSGMRVQRRAHRSHRKAKSK